MSWMLNFNLILSRHGLLLQFMVLYCCQKWKVPSLSRGACFKACSYNKCRANTAEKTQYLHHTKFGAVSIFPCDCKLTSLQVKAFWVLADSSSIPALCWCCGTQPMSEGMLRCTSKKRTTMKPDDNPRFSVKTVMPQSCSWCMPV